MSRPFLGRAMRGFLFGVAIGAAPLATGQCIDRWVGVEEPLGPIGPVTAMTDFDDVLYVAGGFSLEQYGATKDVARWNGVVWEALEGTWNSVEMLTSYNGTLYACGDLHVGPDPRYTVAAWDGQRWVPVGESFDSTVNNVVFLNGQPVACGTFQMNGGVPCAGVARWDGTSWTALGGGFGQPVYDLLVSQGQLLAVGAFPGRVSSWDGTAWHVLSTSFVGGPLPNGNGKNSVLLAEFQGALYANGPQGMFRFNPATKKWVYVSGQPQSASPYAMETAAGEPMYGTFADGIYSFDGAVWTFLGGSAATVLGHHGGQLHVGGDFKSFGGTTCSNVAYWDGAEWNGLRSHGWAAGASIKSMAWFQERLYVAGSFTALADAVLFGTATSDGQTLSIVPGLPPADVFYNYQGDLILGKRGWPDSTVARWNGIDASPVGGEIPGVLGRLGEFQGKLVAVANATVWMFNGTTWIDLHGGAGVQAFASTADRLYAGGGFSQFGGATALNVAQWDGSNWSTVGTGVDSPVAALAWYKGELIAGGIWMGAVRWDGARWMALGPPLSGEVDTLLVEGDRLLLAGRMFLGQTPDPIVLGAWDGQSFTPLVTGSDGTVLAVASDGERLAVGGSFTRVGTASAYALALQRCVCPADANADGYVNGDDFDLFIASFNNGEPRADINSDGFVNGEDFDLFAAGFFAGC